MNCTDEVSAVRAETAARRADIEDLRSQLRELRLAVAAAHPELFCEGAIQDGSESARIYPLHPAPESR